MEGEPDKETERQGVHSEAVEGEWDVGIVEEGGEEGKEEE